MGFGTFSDADYSVRQTHRAATGQKVMSRTSMHPDLSPYGLTVRESRNSAEHPHAIPVAVFFDVTGSMGEVPRILQAKLPVLPQALALGGVEHVQVLFGAVGDEHTDKAPLQVGQFESDIRMDDALGDLLIEGGGGYNGGESYGLALYAMARHTVHDRWERHRRKGYVFLIGDECPHQVVTSAAISRFVGDDVAADIPVGHLIQEVETRYHLFVLHVDTDIADEQKSLDVWNRLMPERVVSLPNPAAVCETIVMIVARNEGIDVGRAAASLARTGATDDNIRTATEASSAVAIRDDGPLAPGRVSGRLPAIRRPDGSGLASPPPTGAQRL